MVQFLSNRKKSNEMKTTFLALTLLISLNSTSCAQSRTAKDAFEVSNFTAIEASVVANIHITQSAGTAVTAEGSEELLNRLEVRIEGDRLILDMEDEGFWKRFGRNAGKLTIRIATPTLTKIDFEGVGNIHVDGTFNTPQLEINSEGVGNLIANSLECEFVKISSEGVGNTTVGGKTNKVEIHSEGVGNVEADRLIAREAVVSSQGVGNVSCYASDFLSIRSQGVGNVQYYGKPEKTDLIKDGVGKIRPGN